VLVGRADGAPSMVEKAVREWCVPFSSVVNPNGRIWAKQFSDLGLEFLLAKNRLHVTDGFRTYEQEQRVRSKKPKLAPKGASKHEVGLAFDVEGDYFDIEEFASEVSGNKGLVRPRKDEPWHFELETKYWTVGQKDVFKRLSDAYTGAGLKRGLGRVAPV